MKTTPLWTDQVPRPQDLPLSTLPAQVDVAVVGSGYTGINAALTLAKNGATVAVLERHMIGWGASSRHAGMATPGLKQSVPVLMKKYGEDVGRNFWQISVDALNLIDEIVAEENLDCDWVRHGHIGLAFKPSHFERMQEKAAWFEKVLGFSYRLVPPAEIRSEIGTDAFFGGMADDISGQLHPAKYMFGLAQAAARSGAALCEQTDVTRIQQQRQGFDVHTSQGVVQAREVIIATNGYTDRLVPGLKPKIFPVGSYIIVTEPLPLELRERISPTGRIFADSKWFLNYFCLTPDGRMLWGGRNNLSTDLDLAQSAAALRRQLVRVFPELRDVPLTHTWTGQLGLTFDLMPHIGRVEGVHYAFGYSGKGLTVGTYLGREIALLLCGQKSSSPFAEIPHQTMFFYRNKPWFLPLAAGYYRFRDWIS